MAEDKQASGWRQPIFPLHILWGITPAILLVASAIYLDIGHIHPESPEFPNSAVNAVLLLMVLVQLSWSGWISREWNLGYLKRFWAVLAFTFFGLWINQVIAFAGCGLFYTWDPGR